MIKGELVTLRTVRSKDLPVFLELAEDIRARGEFFPLNLQTETSFKQKFEKDGFWTDAEGTLLIIENSTGEIVGSVASFQPTHYYEAYEIGYILYRPEARGKGYATEATQLLMKYLFDYKPIHRLQIECEPGNLASQKVALKCGFTFEGTMRNVFYAHGKLSDILMYSITREEFNALERKD